MVKMNKNENVYQSRINKAAEILRKSSLDFLAVNAGPSLAYFSGMHFHLSERPAVLLIGPGKKPAFVFPEFELEKANHAPIDIQHFPFSENISEWVGSFKNALDYLGFLDARVGIEPTSMRFLETDLLKAADQKTTFSSAVEIFTELRKFKDGSEILNIRKAVLIAEKALEKTIPIIKIGNTEQKIANELVINLLREGSEPELPFAPLVASGPHSANPHHIVGERTLKDGDLLIIDWGARYQGYVSDITRTFAVGKPKDELVRIHEVVLEANTRARQTHSDILISGKIDQAARDSIVQAGYGKFFTHRTGHGIGLEAHEAPFITSGSAAVIESGMTFTIEPGIYLPGAGGVRIEDDMLAVDGKLESLTTMDRDLRYL